MEHLFQDVKPDGFVKWLGSLLFVGGLVFLLCAEGLVGFVGLSDVARGFTVIAVYCAMLAFFVPSIVAAAHKDHEHLISVGVWSFVVAVGTIGAMIYVFFAFFGDNASKYDKLLNILPVIIAMWAASIGWLVHFKMSSKVHRTNNSFAIIMEMRKNSEFLKRNEMIAKHFPPGVDEIPTKYRPYFCPKVCGSILLSKGNEDAKDDVDAIRAVRYMLNYYEFIASGIRAGDLDEKLIFDTLHSVIVSQYDRFSLIIDHASQKNIGSDPSHWCELRDLVKKWKARRAVMPGFT